MEGAQSGANEATIFSKRAEMRIGENAWFRFATVAKRAA